ncbi:ABC sugar transporter, permease component [Hoyosella subflava DQS3-9A1]|uniref:ABC sugar transporter, permease component n=1 Tax=Hoyosella subflava (strain DSM 45089 / JCM 17490 / NBRC 109087 / DQS3-9A1) TaxID=443218 RepID=F6EQ59_HOYSD|nr:ABC sugar transporter, permease component [Hoyosella subflava DQS3-9A1]
MDGAGHVTLLRCTLLRCTLLRNNEGLTNWGPVMAGTILTMLPILIVLLILQRHRIRA